MAERLNGTARLRRLGMILVASLMLALAALATPFLAEPALATVSGTTGNCTWELNDEGTLTIAPIEGTDGLLGEASPWFSFKSDIKSVVFEEGVSAQDMDYMFSGCSHLKTVDLSGLDTSNATNMSGMFYDCSSLESLDVSDWDTSSVTDMSWMFYDCSSLESLGVSGWDTSSVTDMSGMFSLCSALESLDVSGWDTSDVTSMFDMFYRCARLIFLDVSSWDVSSVADMSSMFSGCSSLEALDLSSWDTSRLIDVYHMFENCRSLGSLDLSSWDTSRVASAFCMFMHCSSLVSLDVSSWDVSKLVDARYMFNGCDSLKSLDLSSWDTARMVDTSLMFAGCESLESLVLGSDCVFGAPYGLPDREWFAVGQGVFYATTVELIAAHASGGLVETYVVSNSARFTDTPADVWYVTNGTLDYVIVRGIMSGTSDTTFEPGGVVTRAQVATILYNLTGRPAVGEAEAFSDVEPDSWYHDAVMWARSAGVVSGYDDGSFRPGVSVTREQLACMLRNYAGNVAGLDVAVGAGGLDGFADAASVSSWARDSVAWCVGQGIIAGTPSGGSVFVNPEGTAVRAEAAQMVRAFDEKVLGA